MSLHNIHFIPHGFDPGDSLFLVKSDFTRSCLMLVVLLNMVCILVVSNVFSVGSCVSMCKCFCKMFWAFGFLGLNSKIRGIIVFWFSCRCFVISSFDRFCANAFLMALLIISTG